MCSFLGMYISMGWYVVVAARYGAWFICLFNLAPPPASLYWECMERCVIEKKKEEEISPHTSHIYSIKSNNVVAHEESAHVKKYIIHKITFQ